MVKNSTTIKYLIGIDEVGRGPLAGPVCVCSFVIQNDFKMSVFNGIRDSKKLSAKKREEWFEKIKELKKKGSVGYKIAFVSNTEIDRIGISKSIQKAIDKCLVNINPKTCEVLLDGGIKASKEFLNQKTIIKGDEKEKVISLASIIAKVSRDKLMCDLSKKYPKYEFHEHKGYGTTKHIKKIKKYGPCKIHRKTYLKNI